MFKNIFALVIVSIIFISDIQAQQFPIFSQYRENSFVLNPAVAGSNDYRMISLSYRNQWTGINESPQTQNATFRTPIHRSNLGIGVNIVNDQTGPTGFTGINLALAYHLGMTKLNPFRYPTFIRNSRLSFGLSASFIQYRLNASELSLDMPNDPTIFENNEFRLLPNAGLGFYYYYSDNFFLGFSVPQAVPYNMLFIGDGGEATLKRVIHYYTVLGGSINFGTQDEFKIQPMVWYRALPKAPNQLDGLIRFNYDDLVWIGGGYRTSGTAIFEAGFMIAQLVSLGYSYDLGLTDVSSVLGSTHEITLSFRFGDISEFQHGLRYYRR
ncbi:MAG: type IX secretion system membrane protein PorP/SprF [Chitinophagaceae bacterium]|nr:MAG: type IX secretion system membrane protein PorP/SprF [Chitinophagaceae bacterium]